MRRILFTGATAWTGATFAIGVDSMESDIHPPVHELSLFAVGVFPLGFALREFVHSKLSYKGKTMLSVGDSAAGDCAF